jgi:arsenite methyltransferase
MEPDGLPVADGCCRSAEASEIHRGLADLLHRYNVNDYAASVQVYALKPR